MTFARRIISAAAESEALDWRLQTIATCFIRLSTSSGTDNRLNTRLVRSFSERHSQPPASAYRRAGCAAMGRRSCYILIPLFDTFFSNDLVLKSEIRDADGFA